MINIVIINGGRGASVLIPEMVSDEDFNVTSIVNAYDDGKSTGEIRNFFNMLGPSDIRKVQSLMLPKSDSEYETYKNIYDYRIPQNVSNQVATTTILNFISGESQKLFEFKFSNKTIHDVIASNLSIFIKNLIINQSFLGKDFNFKDCSLMNCIYAGAFLSNDRNFQKSCMSFQKLFNLQGSVIPSSNENKYLVALRENGEVLYSEAEIVELRSNVRISNIFLLDLPLQKGCLDKFTPEERFEFLKNHSSYVEINPRASNAISAADIILYAPGTQHSSLFPTYMTRGFSKSIAENKDALKVFVTNIGEDYETIKYKASDFINSAYRYLNSDLLNHTITELISCNFVNDPQIKTGKSLSNYVLNDFNRDYSYEFELIVEDFESDINPGKHDGAKIIQLLKDIYRKGSL